MAEFVASLIGIASLGAKVSLTLHQVVSTLQSAQNDARLISADISIFTCTLTQLSKTISSCNVPEAAQLFEIAQVLVPACSALVNELHKLIGNTELYQMKGSFWMHVLALRFRWLLNGPKVAFVKSMLDSFKSTLVLLISTMDLAVGIHQNAQYDVKESLKSQVRTNIHLSEDAKSSLLLFKERRARSDPPAISDDSDSRSTTSNAPSDALTLSNPPAQSLDIYPDFMPNANESGDLGQSALEEEMNGSMCLSECPKELSGILIAQHNTVKLAEDLLKISHVPTWTWGIPTATKPNDLPKQASSARRVIPSDGLRGNTPVNEPELPRPSPKEQSPGQGEVSKSAIHADETAPADLLNPLQYLDTEEDSKRLTPTPPNSDQDLQEMIRKVLEETLASRNGQEAEQLGVRTGTHVQPQRPILEDSSRVDLQDGTERLSKLERFMLAERDEMVRKAALLDAERQAQKQKSDADNLVKLEKLILAQKQEQLKREAAADAARKADKHEADVKVAREAAEKAAQAEAAAKLLEAAKAAREEAERRAAREAEETKAAHEKALAEAKSAQEELEKAKKAVEEEAAKLKPSDEPKLPIRFKDAVGRKFSFPWHLCKTWKGMEELIKQAFLHVDVIGPHVHDGHYDLVGPDGEIVLPQVWETMVQPDWQITMHMWPMPETPDKPEKGQKLKAGLSKFFERRSSNQDTGRA